MPQYVMVMYMYIRRKAPLGMVTDLSVIDSLLQSVSVKSSWGRGALGDCREKDQSKTLFCMLVGNLLSVTEGAIQW